MYSVYRKYTNVYRIYLDSILGIGKKNKVVQKEDRMTMPIPFSLPSKSETKQLEITNCCNKEKHGKCARKEEGEKGVTEKVRLRTGLPNED